MTTTTAANVRAEMARKQVRQVRLAERLGISQAAVSRRLNGTKDFTVGELHTVADLLGVPVADLLGEAVAA